MSTSERGPATADAGGLTGAAGAGHEQVTVCRDAPTGLVAVIAIHSTALGPALGGTRFFPYADEHAALADVLALSEGMSYKNAVAGLDHGGGKAVIVGDPAVVKTEALLRAYGRFVQSLGGRYITACDVGTDVADMDVVGRECDHVTGRSTADGGAGDSSVLTAYGVFQGMRAAAEHRWGNPSLRGRRVGVAGVGKVGGHLVDHLLQDGADVVVTDVAEAPLDAVRTAHPQVDVVADAEALVRSDIDVYAPCALGGVLDSEVAAALRAEVVCGGANNQLAEPGVADALVERGVVYCPDYVVNAGGVIQVSDELHGFSFERARARTDRIHATTLAVLRTAEQQGITPVAAADRLAERRMAEVSSLTRIWTPRRRTGRG